MDLVTEMHIFRLLIIRNGCNLMRCIFVITISVILLDYDFLQKLGNRILKFTDSESRVLTGLLSNQLSSIQDHLRFPPVFSCRRRYSFSEQEAFLPFKFFLRTGDTKLQCSIISFGGNSKRFTNSIILVTNQSHLSLCLS